MRNRTKQRIGWLGIAVCLAVFWIAAGIVAAHGEFGMVIGAGIITFIATLGVSIGFALGLADKWDEQS